MWWFLLFLIISKTWYCLHFHFCHSDGCVVIPHGVLICIFLISSEVKYFHVFLIGYLDILLCEWSVQTYRSFFHDLTFSLLFLLVLYIAWLRGQHLLHMLRYIPLSWLAFSFSWWCLWVNQVLMKFNFENFFLMICVFYVLFFKYFSTLRTRRYCPISCFKSLIVLSVHWSLQLLELKCCW